MSTLVLVTLIMQVLIDLACLAGLRLTKGGKGVRLMFLIMFCVTLVSAIWFALTQL